MTEALERALAPLLTFGSFFGLGMFEYPRGQPRPYLSCLYALVKWGSLTYFYSDLYLKSLLQHNGTILSNKTIELILINTLSLISLCRFKELKMCLRELAIVDDTLEALGAPKEYQRLRKWIIRIIIGWIAYVFYQFVYWNFVAFFVHNLDINFSFLVACFGFLIAYPSNVIILSALISAVILGLIYLQLCLISRKLNIIFKVQMVLQMIRYFFSAVTLCLSMYYLLGDHQGTWTFHYTVVQLNIYFNMVLFSILFLMLNYVCQTVYFKINETVAILQKLSNYNLDEDLRKQVLQFILQIKQTKVKFGLGQYYFGYNCICEMYSTVLSATIILTQFGWHLPPLESVPKS